MKACSREQQKEDLFQGTAQRMSLPGNSTAKVCSTEQHTEGADSDLSSRGSIVQILTTVPGEGQCRF